MLTLQGDGRLCIYALNVMTSNGTTATFTACLSSVSRLPRNCRANRSLIISRAANCEREVVSLATRL